jgi:hypothetical protein
MRLFVGFGFGFIPSTRVDQDALPIRSTRPARQDQTRTVRVDSGWSRGPRNKTLFSHAALRPRPPRDPLPVVPNGPQELMD